ncbi:FadR family transcriptional regulator [Acuticoccus sp. M5D2P5]|uniref:FadR/GntR family transcriptional regulator n=1 Tax=Acuticoccus kalidii TaxID=2910977 RepID=UPI001F306D9E|nr:FadR family transcriptional regulator [Acuticoccus kalidii]
MSERNERGEAGADAAERRGSAAPDVIASALEDEIARGIYPADSRLPTERELCARFGASRATIREAISKLKHDGIVRSRRGSGVYVARPDNSFRMARAAPTPREQAEIFELRMIVETAGAARAALRWDEDDMTAIGEALEAMRRAAGDRAATVDADTTFHLAIARATGNRYFNDFVRLLETSLRTNVALSYSPADWDEEQFQRNYSEHVAILRAIEARDAERARAAMLIHLGTAADDAGLTEVLSNLRP